MTRIALAGNPNAGKTSLFNHLTGASQSVGNYPGVTVEYREGHAVLDGRRMTVIDLPGTYSLTAYSQEEVIARNLLLDTRPEVVVDVVDASNLERNLYLAVQFMEMQAPLVIALNMCDVAEKRGFKIDHEELSRMLGVPVVRTCGNKGTGVRELLATCAAVADGVTPSTPRPVTYGHEVDREVDTLCQVISAHEGLALEFPPRWIAAKLIERDPEMEALVKRHAPESLPDLLGAAEKAITAIETHCKDDAAAIMAERRYGYAAGAAKRAVTLTGEARQNMTDQIDAIVCNRVLGPLFMIGIVAALFFWVFKISDEWAWIPWFGGWVSPTGFMGWLFEQLSGLVAPLEGPAPMLHSLLNDGIIGGVGGVMGFVPLIFIMFLFISVLEDTGYIARVAFILDRVLQTFGMQGKSILALVVSGGLGAGGCAVPGVMATRTLREEKDRLVTMLVVPFMNCGAKMPVYAMLIAAFFAESRTSMMVLLWGLSWVVALCSAWVLRRFVIKGEQTPFVMELPPYHMPVPRSVIMHTWERTWMYIRKAGTIILALSIVLWAAMYFPRMPEPDVATGTAALSEDEASALQLAGSFAGRLGRSLEPATRWAGFDWRTNIALVGGFAAKEVVIGTLGTVYSMGSSTSDEDFETLSTRLASDPDWSRLKAFALMIFVMLYAPCLVTVVMIRRESGSWKWALFATAYSTIVAFVLAAAVYQAGVLLGLGNA